MRHKALIVFLAAAALAAFIATTVRSQDESAPDPVPLYPENYKVLFEDDRVRVLDFTLKKGASEVFHRHPPNVAVFLAEFTIRFKLPDGKMAIRDAHPGDVTYSSESVIHSPENIGATDAHGILIELKQPASAANR